MSAWLCRNGTLSLVADTIKTEEFQKTYDTTGTGKLEKEEIISRLTAYNTKNLDCLYGQDMDNVLENPTYIKQNVSNAQRHMSVCCYLYQTMDCFTEGEEPLLDSLTRWRDDNYEKYDHWHDTCEWDIDRQLEKIGL